MNLRKFEVLFMGYVIISKGLKLDLKKVKVVEEMFRFISKKELLSFFGFVNYLFKFLFWFVEVVKLLWEFIFKEVRFFWLL